MAQHLSSKYLKFRSDVHKRVQTGPVKVLVAQDCRTHMVQATYQEEEGLIVCVQTGPASLCTIYLWLRLESTSPYFAAIMSQTVCSRIEVRVTPCVSVYMDVSSAFASRKREH